MGFFLKSFNLISFNILKSWCFPRQATCYHNVRKRKRESWRKSLWGRSTTALVQMAYIARELQGHRVTQLFGLQFPLPFPHVLCFGLHGRAVSMPKAHSGLRKLTWPSQCTATMEGQSAVISDQTQAKIFPLNKTRNCLSSACHGHQFITNSGFAGLLFWCCVME